MNILQKKIQKVTLNSRPLVMGILNVTPDSFSDGGSFVDLDSIKTHCDQMISDGVDIIDVGGESTRPGAKPVGLSEELDRVMPVLNWLAENKQILVSIDTYKPQVMKEAIKTEIDLINDVNALQSEGAIEAVFAKNVHICLMHKKGTPKIMQQAPHYLNVVEEVISFFKKRIEDCLKAGINTERILLDPGFGFGKDLSHNIQLFKALSEQLGQLHHPLLIGVSRKRMLGQLLRDLNGELALDYRKTPSVVAAVLASLKGAKILRVHDVKETVDALKLVQALF